MSSEIGENATKMLQEVYEEGTMSKKTDFCVV
jgi:hypothetical protein